MIDSSSIKLVIRGAAFASAVLLLFAVPAEAANARLETSAGAYIFTPTICAVHKEDDVYDIEIGGRGIAPDGEEFYLEFSSTGDELSVGLGVDGPFASAARELRAGRWVSREFTVDVSGGTITVLNLALVDENGQSVDGDATLKVDCDG